MKTKQRFVKCTQEEFNKLPGLVSREEFRDWTGLSGDELSEEVRDGKIDVYRSKPNGYAKYYKREIARLTGFRM